MDLLPFKSPLMEKERMGPGHWSGHCLAFPSVLWYHWLGDRKYIWLVKNCHLSPKIVPDHVEEENLMGLAIG